MKSLSLSALSLLALTTFSSAQFTVLDGTYLGCFSSASGFSNQGTRATRTFANCATQCEAQGQPLIALLDGNQCYCGSSVPSNKVSDSECSISCPGYPATNCGGNGFYQIYQDTGKNAAPYSGGTATAVAGYSAAGSAPTSTSNSGSASSIAASTSPSTTSMSTSSQSSSSPIESVVSVTISGSITQQTIFATVSSTPPPSSGGSSVNKAGLAAGIVVAVVAVAAIIGGLVFYFRRKRTQAIDEERRRHESLAGIMNEKPASTFSLNDSRLEPSVFARRMSDISMADNQDYSRRILKVTNPE